MMHKTDHVARPIADVDIAVYGALTEIAGSRSVQVRVALPCTAATLRDAAGAVLVAGVAHNAWVPLIMLLAQSALADETHVFSDDDLITDGTRGLALVPPVCGG